MRIGRGKSIGHHGEILQGVFEDTHFKLHRALLSLPCRQLVSNATFTPDASGTVRVSPETHWKAKRAAELAVAQFSRRPMGGVLAVRSDIPVGSGFGSSTADVLAAVHAILDYLQLDRSPTPEQIMGIAVEAETACDSILFQQCAVLFAQREGVVLEAFARPLPPMTIVSVNTAPDREVDTLKFQPARYSSEEIEAFRPLLGVLRHAVAKSDINLIGRVATASARINERFLPKSRFDDLIAIAETCGAVGLQVAHSGTIVGLLFDAHHPNAEIGIATAANRVASIGLESTIFS